MIKNLAERKEKLVNMLISEDWLKTDAIINAFRKVPREEFIPEKLRDYAYVNEPLPIGFGQTISQPLTIAVMTEALDVKPRQKVLETGAGSGYQAAILSELVGDNGRIITTERVPELMEFARNNLKKYKNVEVVFHDGSTGYEKEAPYDRIIVTASSPSVPQPLLDQLKSNGKMVIPVGDEMFLIEKTENEIRKNFLGYYVFVPLVGKFGHNAK